MARRRWMLWAAGAYAGILIVVVGGLVLVYREARDRLDEALGLRLQATATAAAQLVDIDAEDIALWSFDPEPASDLIWLASRLEQIRLANDLAEISLCDRDAVVIISTSGRLERGDFNVFWELDRAAVDKAQAGLPGISRLYRARKLYQKSAHAPVFGPRRDVIAVITVEGNADFFDVLAGLRRGALLTTLTVVVFLAILGWLLYRIQHSLERARADLARQEELATMGRMTAGIAHEIRNPLGIIRGAGQHLQRVLGDHGISDETAAFIPEEVDRLDRILTGYLSFGASDPGQAETLDLTRLVRRTSQLVDAELQETGVVIAISEPAPRAICQGDPRRLQQVLLNLLLNARDAMPAGGAVTVAVIAGDEFHEVSVLDEGSGLGDNASEKAFEPFWTSKPKGSGLGLPVSRRIADEHGGRLQLADRPDSVGCIATLIIPAASGADESEK